MHQRVNCTPSELIVHLFLGGFGINHCRCARHHAVTGVAELDHDAGQRLAHQGREGEELVARGDVRAVPGDLVAGAEGRSRAGGLALQVPKRPESGMFYCADGF